MIDSSLVIHNGWFLQFAAIIQLYPLILMVNVFFAYLLPLSKKVGLILLLIFFYSALDENQKKG